MSTDAGTTSVTLRAFDGAAAESLSDALATPDFEVVPDTRVTVRLIYLDTEDWWLYRAGAGCRLLLRDEEAGLALEPLAGADEVFVPEGKLTETVSGETDKWRGSLPEGRLAERVEAAAGELDVRPRLELSGEETTYQTEGKAVAAVRVLQGADGTAMLEVELRGPGDALREAAGGLVSKTALAVEAGSPLPELLDRAGIKPPRLEESDVLTMRADDRFIEAVHRVFRRHFNLMLWNEPGTRLGLDPEYLHDMRVASRRLRAALRLFKKALPKQKRKSLQDELKWLGNALGDVRDLDVYLLHLEDELGEIDPELRPPVERYLEHLRSRRREARRAMIRALNTERYARLVQRFRRLLDEGPPQAAPTPEGEKPVPVMARKLLRKRTKTVLRKGRAAGSDSSDKKLHKLRIRCKRLRYACEFFRDLYGEPAQDFRKRVKELQDILGTNQDAVVARETLSSYAQELPGSDEEMDLLQRAVGELMARHARRSRNARKEFFKAWGKFDSKKVRKPLRDAADRLAQ